MLLPQEEKGAPEALVSKLRLYVFLGHLNYYWSNARRKKHTVLHLTCLKLQDDIIIFDGTVQELNEEAS